ncbi:MAG: mechanosensitive ion channel [Candidatus Thermoplasmatota archaeon]|nr:mechanosensitive ion channel [Candidatus Thermoplasmatota archaeon]
MVNPITQALYDAGLKLGGFGEPFVELETAFWNIVPNLVFLIVLLLIGYVISKFISRVVRRFLERVGFETAMEKVKIDKQFKSIGLESVSHFIGMFVFWFIFLIFLQLGIGAIGIELITDLLTPIVLIIPRALIAALLVVIGLYVGTLVANLVEKILNKSGLKKTVSPIDKELKGTGYTLFSTLSLIIKIWIVLIFVQTAIGILAIQALTDFISPIILFFPRIIVAYLVVLVGLVIANYIANTIKNWLKTTPIGKKFTKADKKVEKGGFSILNLALLFVKAWILLIFIQIALDIVAIDILTIFINPIILYFPRLLVALALVIIGLIVVDIILKIIHKIFDELEINTFIEPVDTMINRPGLMMKFIDFLITVLVLLVFINMAVAVLDITQISVLVNTVILYIPNLFAAAFIIIFGLWFAGWLSDKVKGMSQENELPFPSLIANGVKFIVIFIVITIALAQIRIEVPILYIAFAVVLGAVMVGTGAGFAYGIKDVSANMAGFIQVNEIVTPGDHISVGEYSGTVEKVTKYTTMIRDKDGKQHAIPNTYLVKNTVSK